MHWNYYKKYINTRTKGRCDITPLFQNPLVFNQFIDDLVRPFPQFDKVAGLDALGFIIGGAIAHSRKKGFITIRKGGKLPGKNLLKKTFTDYTKTAKTFEINRQSIRKGETILLVDDWIETGAQMNAAIHLLEKQGGKIVGIACLCAEKRKETKALFEKYNVQAIRIVQK
jgi:adenine phosphoribosyltransferase